MPKCASAHGAPNLLTVPNAFVTLRCQCHTRVWTSSGPPEGWRRTRFSSASNSGSGEAASVWASFNLKEFSGCLEHILGLCPSSPPWVSWLPSFCCNDLIFPSPSACQVFDVCCSRHSAGSWNALELDSWPGPDAPGSSWGSPVALLPLERGDCSEDSWMERAGSFSGLCC